MTPQQVNALVPDDCVAFVSIGRSRATVDMVTEFYVKLCWPGLKPRERGDILLKTSPLWALLELVP